VTVGSERVGGGLHDHSRLFVYPDLAVGQQPYLGLPDAPPQAQVGQADLGQALSLPRQRLLLLQTLDALQPLQVLE
jgi:hypothetical protein